MACNYYVKNKDLLVEIAKYNESGKFGDTLGLMILKIVNGLAHRPNFFGYSYIEDMKSEAHVAIFKGLKNFDTNKSKNPFSYITQIGWNAFIAFINKEKKKSKIKNKLFEMQNLIRNDTLSGINYSNFK